MKNCVTCLIDTLSVATTPQSGQKSGRGGFTMAEILIALAVIGVVAALTIPPLFSGKDKQEAAERVRNDYTSLAQAVKQSEINNERCENWDWGTPGNAASIKNSFDKYWAPYLKVSKFCSSSAGCGYASNAIKNLQGADTAYNVAGTSQTSMFLNDGTFVSVDGQNKLVFVDINGNKGSASLGKDIFVFALAAGRGLMPYGFGNTAAINNDCKSNGVGNYCAAKLMNDGWSIGGDYPWSSGNGASGGGGTTTSGGGTTTSGGGGGMPSPD